MKRVKRLAEIEELKLTELYKSGKTTRERTRSHILLLSNKGNTIKELVDIFSLHRDTISDLITGYNSNGMSVLSDKARSGRPASLSAQGVQDYILEKIAKDSRNLNLILAALKEKFNITIVKITLIRFLKKNKYIWKRMRKSLKNKRDNIAFEYFKLFINKLCEDEKAGKIDLYYFDETSFNLVPEIPYGWIPINENIELPSSKSKNLSVLGFLNRNNDLQTYTIEGSVNSDVVISCFDDFAKDLTKQTVVIIDNAPTHTSKKFKDKISDWVSKNLFVCNLPTYSPELNIIEILWRFIKYKWINLNAYENYEKLKT